MYVYILIYRWWFVLGVYCVAGSLLLLFIGLLV